MFSIFKKHILIRKNDYNLSRYKFGLYNVISQNISTKYIRVTNVLLRYKSVEFIFLLLNNEYCLICTCNPNF